MNQHAEEHGDKSSTGSTTNQNNLVSLGDNRQLDLAGLPQATRDELTSAIAKGEVELQKKWRELNIDNEALGNRITDIGNSVAQVTEQGASATITGSYTDGMGHTEVIIGNTKEAERGKLNRSQRGERDQTLIFFAIAAVVIVIVAAIIFGK